MNRRRISENSVQTPGFGGKSVIISNYLQGASNCIVTTANYFVCCLNECEEILNEIEAWVGAPVADPKDILIPLASLSNFEDEAPQLAGALTKQLQQIADTHGGRVPLHGRLFAQWLHFVFPHECPYPQTSGSVDPLSAAEWMANAFELISAELQATGIRGRVDGH